MVSGHGLKSDTCDTKATTGATVQLSASSITTVTSGAGAGPPGTIVCAGLLAVGKVVSSTMMVWVTLVTFPQASVIE